MLIDARMLAMRLRLPHLDDVGVVKPAQTRDLSQAALGIGGALFGGERSKSESGRALNERIKS